MPTTPRLDHADLAPLKTVFPETRLLATEFRGQTTVIVPSAQLHDIARFLRDDSRTQYNFLTDLTAVDYLGYPATQPGRFAVVYELVSHSTNRRIRLKSYLDPSIGTLGIENDPSLSIASVTDLWAGAEWMEREVFDMYGIRFTGHPDLRRILLWKDFPAHPLRKDYPLRGRGERERYTALSRDTLNVK
ncbi:MAG: NADH-quinone oxidoreductase subunit C [Planctomycetota bacterium]|nr:NADH-quinone oxidoreductase subunit C [Planctomycetota bacterium]